MSDRHLEKIEIWPPRPARTSSRNYLNVFFRARWANQSTKCVIIKSWDSSSLSSNTLSRDRPVTSFCLTAADHRAVADKGIHPNWQEAVPPVIKLSQKHFFSNRKVRLIMLSSSMFLINWCKGPIVAVQVHMHSDSQPPSGRSDVKLKDIDRYLSRWQSVWFAAHQLLN